MRFTDLLLRDCSMTISSVRVAAERLRAVGARPTPVLRSDWVDATAGCACYLKAEHLQRTCSFKYRGATNAEEREKEVSPRHL